MPVLALKDADVVPEDRDTKSKVLVPRKGGKGGGGGKSSGKSGSSSKGNSAPPSYRSSASSFRTSTGAQVSAYGFGSSSIKSLPAGGPFAGRLYDGGLRPQVYGSRTLGSGYPYGGGGYWIMGRPFPFGFWPIYYEPLYYGNDEYGPENNSSRPGGVESFALIQSNNTVEPDGNVYHILGDADSVRAVIDALVLNCSAVNSSIGSYSAKTDGMPQPQQAVQYYRASSFALFLDQYNNTAALPANAPTSNSTAGKVITDTLLPDGLDMTFLTCINTTIGNAVPMTSDAVASVGDAVDHPFKGAFFLFFLILLLCLL
ncbi:hypothetical protein CALCODRAFT_457199 [Calocera cornea HHB12733]|uniref:Uncharacterized protein n=1 Tax=Calocera cornea HHB12733 TaxID=1353952 RepID=A0A165E431_9BASI|nr:hypothetical protein CALCODRAFT_457199 [Calocera cornea HHB12733]